MKIMIKGTGKLADKELHIYDNNGIDWVEDCIDAGELPYDSDLDACVMTQEEFDWWVDYLAKAQADYDEEQELRALYGSNAVLRILDDEFRGVNDYDDRHAAYQRAFARIRAELGGSVAGAHRNG
jgi:hypothetical protein